MITKKLKDLVRDEAAKLKANATEGELARLDFDNFDPDEGDSCIYGQMTRWCRSRRAVTLLKECAVSFAGSIDEDEWASTPPVNGFTVTRSAWFLHAFSPIEVYIAQPEAKNENLIAYLKGEKKRLVI